jgi:predicted GNAT family N-acyltransferase
MEPILRKYSDLTIDELSEITKLIIKGGEVNPETLPQQLAAAEMFAFVKNNNVIVATATIKIPLDSYKTKVFTNSNSKLLNSEYLYELGYVMVDEEFRKEKLASKLCAKLFEKYSNSKLFATTRTGNYGMLSILSKNSFEKIGIEYQNRDKTAFITLLIK